MPPRCAILSVHTDIPARQYVQQTAIARRSVFCAPTLSPFIFIPTSSTFADFFRRHTIVHVTSHNRSFPGEFLHDCPSPTRCGRQTGTRGTARRWQLHAPTGLVFHMRPLDCRRAATTRSCSALPDFLLVTAPSLFPRHLHRHIHPRKRSFLAFEAPRSCASLSECQPSSGSRTLFHTVRFRRTTDALQIYEWVSAWPECLTALKRPTARRCPTSGYNHGKHQSTPPCVMKVAIHRREEPIVALHNSAFTREQKNSSLTIVLVNGIVS